MSGTWWTPDVVVVGRRSHRWARCCDPRYAGNGWVLNGCSVDAQSRLGNGGVRALTTNGSGKQLPEPFTNMGSGAPSRSIYVLWTVVESEQRPHFFSSRRLWRPARALTRAGGMTVGLPSAEAILARN